jgi:translocation and assembly module TamA
MFRKRFLIPALLFALAPFLLIAEGISYHVDFEGVKEGSILKEMRLASHLTSLKKRPASINALRYRADSDIPTLIKILQAHGYYESKVNIQIQEIYNDITVVVMINPGPRYHLEAYDVELDCEDSEVPRTCCQVGLKEAGIELNKPAVTSQILNAEMQVMQRLSECGYPLAKIENRDVIVDGKTKGVRVTLKITTGPKAEFGKTQVLGTKRVKPRYIVQKLKWKEGEDYNSRLVEKTQNALIDTGLFNSVLITHEESSLSDGKIPMKVEVSETKYKNVNVGVSYQTVFGPGITFGWANRNVGGMGRTLSFQGDITRISQTGVATYLHPDFKRIGQDMIAQGQAAHEDIFAYSMRSYSLLDRFERQINPKTRGSLGLKGSRLYITQSVQNGNFWLMELPFYLRYSTANSLLNPTRGATLEYTVTPALNVAESREFYLTQKFTAGLYNHLDAKDKVVLAHKITLGFIASNGLSAVPLSNRFLGGTEDDLRGYRYKSVSPLVDGKPIGGRAAIYYTFESRFRLTKTIGLVPFFDLGSVYKTEYPTLHGKWFKATGLGFRFFTFMGPFRVDLAFPLDRRKKIDSAFKIYVSIGQMF